MIEFSAAVESRQGAWSVQQRQVAHLLAMGQSKTHTAAEARVPQRTLYRWLGEPDFVAYIDELHQATWERIEPQIMSNVLLALEVQRQVLTGEAAWNDRRLGLADKLITRILDRLLYVEVPATASGTVNVLVDGRR